MIDFLSEIFIRVKILWALAREYDENRYNDILELEARIDRVNDRIGRHTTVHADIHWGKRPHQIIVIGKYQNRDYVRVFDMEAKSWVALIDELRATEKNARVGRFDLPHSTPFSVVYENDRL